MKKFKKIYVEITNRCNLCCSFCGNTARPMKEMSVEKFRLVISKIKPYTDYIYLHVKGETLLHSHLKEILDVCHKNDIFVNITTNGTLLLKQEQVLLSSPCIRQINVSLHCEHNDVNYFDKVFCVCQRLAQKMYVSYRLWTMTDSKLDEKLTDIVNKIATFYKLSPEIVEKIEKNKTTKIFTNTFVDKENEFIWPSDNVSSDNEGFCHALSKQIAILVDGTIVPCCLDGEGEISLGNIFSDDLEEVFKSERFLAMLNGFRNNKSVEKLCQRCNFKNRFINK